MPNSIFIRTDCSASTGLGHIIRCFALAKMLQSDFKVTFVCKTISKNIASDILINGFQIETINDENVFISLLHKKDIVIIDSYDFDISLHNFIKEKGCLLVCVDDLHNHYFIADLVINHTPGIKKEHYDASFYTQFALGLDYVLLREPFLLSARKNEGIEKKKINDSVMICLGGSDPCNITEKALTTVRNFPHFTKIIVVIGDLYRHVNSLREHCKNDKRVKIFHNLSALEMAEVMKHSDISIVPSSGILFESLACGCIVVAGVYMDNQKFVYKNFISSKTVYGANDFGEQSLSKALTSAINDRNNNSQSLIDGHSDERLLDIFRKLSLSACVELSLATLFELDITYKWATNKSIRNHSFTRNLISYEEHTNWFKSKLVDSNCVYLIAQLDGCYIGSIRFDYKDNTNIISYLIDPAFQGKGLGQALLQAGIQYVMKYTSKKPVSFTGYVVNNNIPSLRAFRKLSFVESKENEYYKFELVL